MDLGLVSLFSLRQREPDYSRVEVLDLPLVTAFESRRSKTGHSLKVLDIPLFSLFEFESDDQGRHDIGVINMPLVGSLYRHSIDDDKIRLNVLYLFRSETPREDPPSGVESNLPTEADPGIGPGEVPDPSSTSLVPWNE